MSDEDFQVQVLGHLSAVGQRFDAIAARLDAMDGRFDALHHRLCEQDALLDVMIGKTDRVAQLRSGASEASEQALNGVIGLKRRVSAPVRGRSFGGDTA